MLPNIAKGINPDARTIPEERVQNKKTISEGSLIAVRKRTMVQFGLVIVQALAD